MKNGRRSYDKIKKVWGCFTNSKYEKMGDFLTIKIKKVEGCFIDRNYEKRETFLRWKLRKSEVVLQIENTRNGRRSYDRN